MPARESSVCAMLTAPFASGGHAPPLCGIACCAACRRTEEEEEEFHKKSLVTQNVAKELADAFNKEADALGIQNLPKVAYMTCCFVATGKMEPDGKQVPDPNEPESRLLFAERRIDGEFRCAHARAGSSLHACLPGSANPHAAGLAGPLMLTRCRR